MGDVASMWVAYLEDDGAHLEDLAVSLALRCERGGAKIISLLLEGAACDQKSVAVTCQVLIGMLKFKFL